MENQADQPLDALSSTIAALRDALEDQGVPHVFIGGVAVAALGRPRTTRDVDALVLLRDTSIHDVLAGAKRHGIAPRIADAEAFAATHNVLLLVHETTGVTIEVALGMLPFEEEAVERAREVSLGQLRFRIPLPEDLIVMKAVAHRPQDLEDIRSIVEANPHLDRRRIMRRMEEFAEALDSPDLLSTVERLLGEG